MMRYFHANRREISTYFDYFYWPLIDMFLFGFLGTWLSEQQNSALTISLITALVLWSVTYRSSLDIARNMAQELWDENLLNFFATPIKLAEWVLGLMSLGILSLFITVPYTSFLAKLIFNQNIFNIGSSLFMFVGLLIMSGWILGFVASSLLIYYGQKIETVVWAIPWLITPFSSIYYPISVMPSWAQSVSKFLPTMYAFEGVRKLLTTGQMPYHDIGMSLLLNTVYLIAALLFFNHMFKKSKNEGLNPN
jgi:ABC-2 type transport system permease protein